MWKNTGNKLRFVSLCDPCPDPWSVTHGPGAMHGEGITCRLSSNNLCIQKYVA